MVAVTLVLGACAGTGSDKSTGEYIDDAAITAKVKTALIGSPETKALNIEVETYKGVVQLSGFVDSDSEKEEAERLAEDVNGVARVENRLSVK